MLDDMRNNVYDVLKVKLILTKKGLWNIKRNFHFYVGLQYLSDYMNVNMWINKMIELPEEENPVLHYNLEKETFILIILTNFQLQMFQNFGSSSNSNICIDNTHCTNESGLQLTIIVVVDEIGNGFSCAYSISKKLIQGHGKYFFRNSRIEFVSLMLTFL